jgi:DNA modification methylase
MTHIDTIHTGDCLAYLRSLPSGSVDCCVCSPPYYGLRDYGVEGQIGLEESPEAFIERLVAVFREVRRVLKPDGTLWVNINDCYAGSGKGAAQYPDNAAKYKQGTNRGMVGQGAVAKVGFGDCKPKDLIGIPWMLAFALRADGWYWRCDVIWNKRNAMPESVTDRPTRSHEYILLFAKSPTYYFDHEAIKEIAVNGDPNPPRGSKGADRLNKGRREIHDLLDRITKRNKRSVWDVSTKPLKEAHFATYPEDLISPCILAGCREGGVVLDPFMGAGTTAVVARKLNRHFAGCDLNPEYVGIAQNRLKNEIGLFL